ncbi:MAG: phytanoyl-CoA dioxygenase family protein [Candidatus Latescibacterota bacterium]|nr:phytanoyl-CoA dioxygenase family protein [Candidatus Latescibacterota bacterium]
MSITNAMPDVERDLEFFPVHNASPQALTAEQVRQYNELGFICPLDVYDEAEARRHREFFDELMDRTQSEGRDPYSINGWHRHMASIHDLLTESRMLDYLEDLLGPNLICWGTHYFCKLPGDVRRVSWHQDASYWPLTPSKTITVWLAIDDSATKNGAMMVIPGSHVHGQIAFEKSSREEHNVLNQTVINPTAYGGDPVPLEMHAGQISLHTDLLLHGSEPNVSDRRRCGLTMRFVSADVRAHKGWNGNSVICRGRDDSSHWAHWPRPEIDKMPPVPDLKQHERKR